MKRLELAGTLAVFLLANGLPAQAQPTGAVVAWGWNIYGQTTSPAGLTGVPAIAANGFHTVALQSDGTVVAWGSNFNGQTAVPAGLTGVTAIAAGGSHTVALQSDGTVVAWGRNDLDQTTVPVGLSGVTAIAAGNAHTVALQSGGTVVAWGWNAGGQTTIPAGLSGVTAVAAGAYYTVALRSDGTVVAWGDNGYGQTNVPAGLSNVTAIAAGNGHTVALRSDGTVVAWGDNSYGQTNVPAGLSGVTAIAAGTVHTVALKSDGTVVAWGGNDFGQTTVPAGLTGVTAIAAGGYHTVALVGSSPPSIATQPVNLTASAGANALFSVTATGMDPPSYQWQVSSDNGAHWSNLSNDTTYGGVNLATLTVTTNSGLNGYQYRCVVSNGAGTVAGNAATLTVNPAPVAPGTWSLTGSISAARNEHTATLLPDGRVLVSGGQSSFANVILASAEIYDPALGTWSLTDSMSTPRTTHTATLLPDGRVLVTGGYSGSAFLASAEIYDPALGTWSPTDSMSTARRYHTATLLPDGRVLVSGGVINSGAFASAEIYDPLLGTWSPAGSMSTGRYLHTDTLLPDGRVLVSGGHDGVSAFLASTEIYDPALGTWSLTDSMSAARFYHAATLLPDGRVLVSGGYSGSAFLASAEIYDPALGTWSLTDSMITPHTSHTATLLPDGRVLVSGGQSSLAGTVVASAEIYDPVLGTWSLTDSMSTARYDHTATLLPYGRVLITGGYSGSAFLASAEVWGTDAPPVITTQPASVTVTAGQNATFTVAANGTPAPTFQWQVSTDNGSNWSNLANDSTYSGVNLATLTVSTSSGLNGYQYRCVVSNSAGTVTSDAASAFVQFSDTTNPVLTALSFPSSVDATAADGTLTVSFSATDDLSGVILFNIRFAAPSGSISAGNNIFFAASTNASGSLTVVFPRFSQPGTWVLSAIDLRDAVGNNRHYETAELAALGFPEQVEVISTPDTTPPALTALSFVPPLLDTSAGAAALMVNFGVSDDLSGAILFNIRFGAPSGSIIAGNNVFFAPAAAHSGSLAVNFPQFSQAGTWTVEAVSLRDAAGNDRNYTAAELAALGFPDHIEVASISDTTPPVLTAFAFTPTTINASGGAATVDIAFSETDDISGAILFDLRFRAPSGEIEVGNNVFFAAGQSVSNTMAVSFPQFSETGVWTVVRIGVRDHAGNQRNYSTADLVAAGFPTQLNVIGGGIVAPNITAQPSNQTVTTGQNATFMVAADGTPAPTFQWQVSTDAGSNWSNLANDSTYSGVNLATLTVSTNSGLNGNQYRSVVSNSAGTVTSAPATLTVNTLPAITTQPVGFTASVNGSGSLTVVATGTRAPTYQWRKAGVPISGATSATLNFASLLTGDAGSYDVVVTNAVGSVTSNAVSVAVNKLAQTITFTPPGSQIYPGGPVTLHATASSGLPVSFSLVSGPATVSGNMVTLTGAGLVTLRATQAGDTAYAAAAAVDQSFNVSAAPPPVVPVALVNHAPTLNGTVEGSVQMLIGESTTLNGGASVTGNLLVRGTPTVKLNGAPTYGGTTDGSGSATPSGYTITLNGGSSLGHVVRRTNPVAMPTVAAPPSPTGTRSVNINSTGQSVGPWTTLRNLTLNSNVGQIAVPAGTYGDFTANSSSGFTLGVAGATQPSVYYFQHLTLNGNSSFQVVGPVIVVVASGVNANSSMGVPAHPGWLKFQLSSGGLTLNGNVSFSGFVTAPLGTVTINGNSLLIGGSSSDRLTINGSGRLRLIAPAGP